MERIAAWIEQILSSPNDEALPKAIRAEVRKLCQKFPLGY
jgi:glycine/serine hydroxymethyltransferase